MATRKQRLRSWLINFVGSDGRVYHTYIAATSERAARKALTENPTLAGLREIISATALPEPKHQPSERPMRGIPGLNPPRPPRPAWLVSPTSEPSSEPYDVAVTTEVVEEDDEFDRRFGGDVDWQP